MRRSSIVGWGALLWMGLAQATPAASREDAPENGAHDLTADRFYNRAGATRSQYDMDWEECRLIARGAPPPSKSFSTNLGVAEQPLGILPAVLNETIERRFSRNTCLLTRGW